jgi:hypothetical protein
MTTDARRNEIEAMRSKISRQIEKLEAELEPDGHDMVDCPLLCFSPYCSHHHTCPVCDEDGE